MKKQADYWRRNVGSWEQGAYHHDDPEGREASFVDRLSSRFRGDSIYHRAECALKLLAPHLDDRVVLDVGCASGRMICRMLGAGAKRCEGIDLSDEILAAAKARCDGAGLADKVALHRRDVTDPEKPLPEADITIALGVVEYFDRDQFVHFMANLRSPYYFFGFPLPQEGFSLRWLLRKAYLTVKGCPGVFFYTQEDFKRIAADAGVDPGPCRIEAYQGHDFLTNLPPIL